MLDKNYYNYYPINSIVHQSNPTIKLICFIIVIILNISINQINLLVTGCYTMLLCILSLVPIKYYFKFIWSLRYFIAFLIIVLISSNMSLINVIILSLKPIIILLNLMIIIYTTSPFEIAHSIDNVLYPFNIFFIKTGKISITICLLLKFIPTLLTSTNVVIESESSRGFDYIYRSFIGKIWFFIKSFKTIIIKTIKEMSNINESLLQGLYNCNKKRTSIDQVKISVIDIILLIGLFGNLIYSFKEVVS